MLLFGEDDEDQDFLELLEEQQLIESPDPKPDLYGEIVEEALIKHSKAYFAENNTSVLQNCGTLEYCYYIQRQIDREIFLYNSVLEERSQTPLKNLYLSSCIQNFKSSLQDELIARLSFFESKGLSLLRSLFFDPSSLIPLLLTVLLLQSKDVVMIYRLLSLISNGFQDILERIQIFMANHLQESLNSLHVEDTTKEQSQTEAPSSLKVSSLPLLLFLLS